MTRPVASAPVTALVVGATGLVGRECVRQLAAQGTAHGVARTIALVRRVPPAGTFPPTVDVVALDFALLTQASAGLGATHVVCALGCVIMAQGWRTTDEELGMIWVSGGILTGQVLILAILVRAWLRRQREE